VLFSLLYMVLRFVYMVLRFVAQGGSVDVNGFDAALPPPCNGQGQPTVIEVDPFEPNPS
jgi:hypothetical protein